MRIATWNVNSVRARLPRVIEWLEAKRPDVVCLQETKVVDEDFPREEIEALGYSLALFGQKTYNGVAIASLHPIEDVSRGLAGDGPDDQKRVIEGTVRGIRIVNLYVPNGNALDHEDYGRKLEWLGRLRTHLDERYSPGQDLVMLGDINIAPEDRDAYDPVKLKDTIHLSEPERAALRHVKDFGLVDALRMHHREGGIYSWWDFRGGMFRRGLGLRIDLIYMTEPLALRCADVEVDLDARRGEKPSDHTPVVATIE